MSSVEELEREICELAAHIAAATARWLALIAQFDSREGWAEWGVQSCAHWLSWRCGIGLRSAREHVRVARALTALPAIAESFGRGELSYSKVRALTRVAEPGTEASLLELARHATGAQLEKLVRGYRGVLRAGTEDANEPYGRRYLDWDWDDDGSLVLRGRLPAEAGAALVAALEAIPVPEAEQEEAATCAHPSSARRADALATLAQGAINNTAQVVLHVDLATLGGDHVHEQSELEGGPCLAPETARRLACDAAIVRLAERDGHPIGVGRRTRAIPPSLRRALHSRDRGCRFPGCDRHDRLAAHHVHHWARGGRTDLDNLVELCPYHHRLVHEGGFSVEMRRGRRVPCFRRPDGREVRAVPRITRARGASLAERHRQARLGLNDRTCFPMSAGDSLDYGMAVEHLLWERERRPGP
jgi:hypothetical protein